MQVEFVCDVAGHPDDHVPALRCFEALRPDDLPAFHRERKLING
jgi:hypothetical protein